MKRLEDCDFESAAKALRPGHECSVKRPKTAQEIFDQAGGTNYHVPIDFDDGVQWLARVRRISNTQPPVINIRRTMDSEIATMQALFSAGIKVPQVYAPKTGGECLGLVVVLHADYLTRFEQQSSLFLH